MRHAGDIRRAPPGPAADMLDMVAGFEQALVRTQPGRLRGRVSKAVGMLIDASGVQAHVGELCELSTPGEPALLAEVVGFCGPTAILTPLGPMAGLSALTEVVPTGRGHVCPVGEGLLGRVLDAMGQPMDALGPLGVHSLRPVHGEPPHPLQRRPIDRALATGIRAIDGLLTLGEGQRVGVFAPAGVGKSMLLGMLARGTPADVIVVALVGERGREVREFIEHKLGPAQRGRCVMVVSTPDRPPMERIKSAYVATTIAEHFRDQGLRVLLLVDSLTRVARAQREIGLACGEPPTRRSYPPSIFSMLPQLLERSGPGRTGSITAVYAVLTEGEADDDPIAEEVRAILDGHIMLSRKLAAARQHPAIDVPASLSRVMPQVVTREHDRAATRLRELLAHHQEMELLIQIGEYQPGSDPLADQAIRCRPAMQALLAQAADCSVPFDDTVAALRFLADASTRAGP